MEIHTETKHLPVLKELSISETPALPFLEETSNPVLTFTFRK